MPNHAQNTVNIPGQYTTTDCFLKLAAAFCSTYKPLLEATAHKQSSAIGLASQGKSFASAFWAVSVLGPWPLQSEPPTDPPPAASEHTPSASAGPAAVAPNPLEGWALPPAPGEGSRSHLCRANGTSTAAAGPSIPVSTCDG